MNAGGSITIIGGGVAGLTLGIALRRQDVPVTVWEAGGYPRHKVCGEFISGHGLQSLERLGLQKMLLDAGARRAKDAAFYVNGLAPVRQVLPQSALCLSRYVLDQLLANEFRALGGDLKEKQRWSGESDLEGMVQAVGHRIRATVDGWRWLGLKVHARAVPMEADLELHFNSNGYVGLCRLEDKVNICGLFRSAQPIPDLRQRWKELLAGNEGSELNKRLTAAELDETSFCAVAGLCLEPQRARTDTVCAIGDALTMIPPATGNGMSMAIESAELAWPFLVGYSRGEMTWDNARREIADACNKQFASRLKVANQLQGMLFQPAGRTVLWLTARWFPSALRFLYSHTR